MTIDVVFIMNRCRRALDCASFFLDFELIVAVVNQLNVLE